MDQEKLRIFIKEKRIAKEFTQKDMTLKMGYKSKSTYNLLENGPTAITTEHLRKISEILEFTKEEVIELTNIIFS